MAENKNVIGSLDAVDSHGNARGWCWAPDEPNLRRLVSIVIGDARMDGILCDEFRADLMQNTVGDGRHAFKVQLNGDATLYSPGTECQLIDEATGTLIASRQIEAYDEVAAARLRMARLDGRIDGVSDDGVITGWAWVEDDPDRHLDLEIIANDERLATVCARSMRADLQKANIGHGDHAFTFILPWSVVSAPIARIIVQEAETGTVIGVPIVLQSRRSAQTDARIRDLEHHVTLLQSRLEELQNQNSTGTGARDRQLLEAIGGFFLRLAEPGKLGGSYLEQAFTERLLQAQDRHRPLTLAMPEIVAVTIIIHGPASLDQVYASIVALQAEGADKIGQIVLVDDGSVDDLAFIPTIIRNIHYLRLTPGQNAVSGLNEATKIFGLGKFVAFLCSELSVTPGWLATILDTFAEDLDTAVIGSKILRADGIVHQTGWIAAADRLIDPGYNTDPRVPEHNFLRPVDAVGCLSSIVRRAELERLGGLDEAFFNSDLALADMCLRLRVDGRSISYQPLSKAVLSTVGSRQAYSITELLAMHEPSGERLRQRWLNPTSHGVRKPFFVGHALVVDNKTPETDRDAGSVATFEQAVLLRKLGWHVTFIAAEGPGDDEIYADALRQRGVETLEPPYHPSVTDYLIGQGSELTLVMVYRHANMTLLQHRIKTYAPRARTIFAPADLHHLREQRMFDALDLPAKEASLAETREQEIACIEQSDATILPSDYELDLLAQIVDKSKLWLLRWVTNTYAPTTPFSRRHGLLFVGTFDHLPNTNGILWFINEVMPLILAEVPDIVLYVVGSNPRAELRALASPHVKICGWVKDLTAMFEQTRVGIAPLRYGAGFKGKVATTLAHGVPMVATSVALEGTGLTADGGVDAADDPLSFAQAVIRLHQDQTRWTFLSKAAIESCEALYSRSAALDLYKRLLESIELPWRSDGGPKDHVFGS